MVLVEVAALALGPLLLQPLTSSHLLSMHDQNGLSASFEECLKTQDHVGRWSAGFEAALQHKRQSGQWFQHPP